MTTCKTNILKEVLKHQVYPAMGCTEPVSAALVASHASAQLKSEIKKAVFYADAGTFKNGLAVRIPNTKGEKGNLLASAMGLFIARPELGMEILSAATPAIIKKAKKFIAEGKIIFKVAPGEKEFFIRAEVTGDAGRAVAEIAGSHTNLSFLEHNGKVISSCRGKKNAESSLKAQLGACTLTQLIKSADRADAQDLAYIKKGVDMNLAACKKGRNVKKVGYFLEKIIDKGLLSKNLVTETKILAARVADARMDGMAVPVMSSGESGNQGVVAILVPYNIGKKTGVDEERILRSIALSHMLNGYVKVYTGSLSPLCGCAIAAGVGAAAAIVYQKTKSVKAITLAINNIISDIGGMLCDGAKSGCALKVVSSVDSCIRAAYMGLSGYGISEQEGFVGKRAEDTIKNLGSISITGMGQVDNIIIGIMQEKIK